MHGGADNLLQELGKILRINAFDEANTEMLSTLPVAERPTTPSAAFAWISTELETKSLTADLEFARPDAERRGERGAGCLRNGLSVQEPHPRFWRDPRLTSAVEAIVRVFLDWKPS